MPELPEVETTCRGIAEHIIGQNINRVDVHQARLRYPVNVDLAQRLQDQTIKAIDRRAKYILIHLTHGGLLIHLGMSGSLRIIESSKNIPLKKHDHVEIHLNGKRSLRYHDPRRFGFMLWHDSVKQHPLLSKLGPEPLDESFNADYLFEQSRTRSISVKAFIMNQQVVVGVGNIYATEALFIAGIHPNRSAKRISKQRYSLLAEAIKNILSHAITQGGTTLRDFINSQGEPGYFQQSLLVYGRADEPCTQCSRPLKHLQIAQRSTVYCGYCQR